MRRLEYDYARDLFLYPDPGAIHESFILLRRGFAPRRVARPMQATDLVVTSLLVYVTGGAQSPYAFLYALSIVGLGNLLSPAERLACRMASTTS